MQNATAGLRNLSSQLFLLGRCSVGTPRDKDDGYNQQCENQYIGDDIDSCTPDRCLLRSGLLRSSLLRSGVKYRRVQSSYDEVW